MSLTNLFLRSAPQLGGFEFDAVLEDTLELEVTRTGYVIEAGANVTDHRVIQPFRYTLTGVVSDNPVQASVTDFIGVLTGGAGGVLSQVAGLSAGFLSGSTDTRGSSALNLLIALAVSDEVFDVVAGDRTLVNMSVVRISRTKDAENEQGLMFVAELQELPTLTTSLSSQQPSQSNLSPSDPASTQATSDVSLGELSGIDPTAATTALIAAGGFL